MLRFHTIRAQDKREGGRVIRKAHQATLAAYQVSFA